jgi:threonine dehydrogenase-like Zn-dependent dehydrogenase
MLRELVLNEDFKPCLKDYTDSEVPAGHVRVESLCGAPKHGTELTVYKEDPFAEVYYDEETHIFRKREEKQSVAGHMGLGNIWVGIITELGEGVTGFSIGERVAGYGNLRNTHTRKVKDLLKMPETMSWKQAVCFDPLQFALGGIRDAHVRMGDKVLISGLGAIGLMAAQAAKLAGASFVAVSDPIVKRRETALANGADIAFDPKTEDIGLILRDRTNGIGVDVVIETSGNYMAIEQGLRALAYGGTLAMVGWLKTCKYPIHLGREGHFNQQKIIFSRACSDPNNDYPRWSFKRICDDAWEMLCKGMFNCERIVDPVVTFDTCDKAYIHYVDEHPEESVKMGVSFK